jgi:ribonucleoside-triphosphate reductase (thioredoxin)
MTYDGIFPEMSLYANFIHQSRYARWLSEEQRRETWMETVHRYFDFFQIHLKQFDYTVTKEARQKLERLVLSREVMPSMRALMTAGIALERENMAGFNCSYIAIDRPTAWDEILYILMNGTGVGYSVENKYVSKLPIIAESFEKSETVIVVPDSKLGWAKATRELIALLYAGQIPSWDVTRLRPAGAPLKTFGGRSSGPEPLTAMFRFAVALFQRNAGKRLSTLDCHDLACKIADTIVVGGVRRSALICLSDINDDLMRGAKSGRWWDENPQRALANISYVADERPKIGLFMKEWLSLYESRSGERGIFSRLAARNQCVKTGRRDPEQEWGTNPCSEIILRSRQVCNLTEVIVRANDTEASLRDKVEAATVLGTWQSTLTDFRFLPAAWKKNTEEERLLGVSLTGIWDNPLTYYTTFQQNQNLASTLESLKQHAIDVNKGCAKKLGINASAAITCVKPSGTVSQLVECASGIHPRHSPYYIRTVRMDKKDPMYRFMVDQGFKAEDEIMHPESTAIFSFPQKSPENAVTKDSLSPVDHLEMWRVYQNHWCEHKPSCTISIKENEWLAVGDWVYQHYEEISGLSFLPATDHVYEQAPYQECDIDTYEQLTASLPDVDWSLLREYEREDNTKGTQELSCSAGVCEIP